jgi:serine/threonine-protein kinase
MITCAACDAKLFVPGDLEPLSTTPCTKCREPVLIPMRLRQFELRSIIGAGGMGTVYRAFDLNLQREVAVKLMRRELAADAQSLDSFTRAPAPASTTPTSSTSIRSMSSNSSRTW